MGRVVTLVLVRPDGTVLGAVPKVAVLRLAIIYQRVLDGIEETERRYHEADVPQQLRDAAQRATEEVTR
jgi:hypothetical protein